MPNLMKMTPEEISGQLEANVLAVQNDTFRKHILPTDKIGKFVFTQGINDEGQKFIKEAFDQVRTFDDFNENNDPYHDHTFGAVEVFGKKVWFKIDLFDENYEYGADNPTELQETRRVLTVLFPSEY